MRRMEDELKSALRHKPAPPDLVRRVVSGLPSQPERGSGRFRDRLSTSWFRWSLAGAAACLLILFAVFQYDGFLGPHPPPGPYSPGPSALETSTEKGEQAKREVLLALQITGSKLQAVHQAIYPATGRSQPDHDRNQIN